MMGDSKLIPSLRWVFTVLRMGCLELLTRIRPSRDIRCFLFFTLYLI